MLIAISSRQIFQKRYFFQISLNDSSSYFVLYSAKKRTSFLRNEHLSIIEPWQGCENFSSEKFYCVFSRQGEIIYVCSLCIFSEFIFLTKPRLAKGNKIGGNTCLPILLCIGAFSCREGKTFNHVKFNMFKVVICSCIFDGQLQRGGCQKATTFLKDMVSRKLKQLTPFLARRVVTNYAGCQAITA